MEAGLAAAPVFEEFPLTPNALKVLEKRYLKKDDRGEVCERPEDMFHRVAQTIAEVDRRYDPEADVEETARQFYHLMASLAFMPNSPTLMNAGRELGQLSACFVLPVDDDISSIFEAIKHTALIHKSGGGTGFSFSRIRPENDRVLSTKGVASGPISFMNIFDVATETIKQGGTRRGANMAILRIDHPDIEKFITCKNQTDKLTNFNISVAVTDAFMEALSQGRDFPLINPRTRQAVQQVNASALFDLIVKSAWSTGEPGIIFIDVINRANTIPQAGAVESTNPCGEQPLLPYESCNLGSINLAAAVQKQGRGLCQTQRHRLDRGPFPGQRHRRQPLPPPPDRGGHPQEPEDRPGGHGLCRSAAAPGHLLQFPGSGEGRGRSHGLHPAGVQGRLRRPGRKAGQLPQLPRQRLRHQQRPGHMRNATTTTIAPTGTISIIAGCSSGIEPLFAISFVRRVLDGAELVEVHPYFEEVAQQRGFYSGELMRRIAQTGSIRDLKEIPKDVRRLFVTAHDITPQWHVRIQAAFQKYTDNAVSKTVNFPASAAAEDVRQVYLLAYELGLKGITIYRDRSRDQQVLSFGADKPKEKTHAIAPRPRPTRTLGITELINTGCGKLYVTVNKDEVGFCEVFAQMGKTGGCASSQIESTGRLISLALRAGVELDAVIKQISGIRCPNPHWSNGGQVLSCPDAIAKVLAEAAQVNLADQSEDGVTMGSCPDCGGTIDHEGGCVVCRACGFSRCS